MYKFLNFQDKTRVPKHRFILQTSYYDALRNYLYTRNGKPEFEEVDLKETSGAFSLFLPIQAFFSNIIKVYL